MNLRLVAAAAVAAVMVGTLASAHHSVEGAFEPTKRMHLTGVITKVQWTNPHIYVYLDVKDGTKNYAFILRVTYPDGHSYQLYNNPDAAR